MDTDNVKKRMKRPVTIIQRFIPHYRVPFFHALSKRLDVDLVVVHGGRSRAPGHPAYPGRFPFKTAVAPYYQFSLFGFNLVLQPGSLKAVRSHPGRVVVAEGSFNNISSLLVALYCRLTGRKFMLWVGGWERPGLSRWKQAVIHTYIRLALKMADGFIAYGTVAKGYLTRFGAPPEWVYIAHNSVDTEDIFANSTYYDQEGDRLRQVLKLEDKKIVLSVGALRPEKRVDTLIHAYARVRRRSPEVALVIVGDGPHREELEGTVETFSVENVTFVGRVVEEVNAYFAMADLFVLPGLGGLALNQAMAFGLPVICSEADGTERDLVVEGVNGHIVKTGDVGGLAAAIENTITHDERLREMGRQSLKIVKERINLQNMVHEFSRAIHSVACLPSRLPAGEAGRRQACRKA